MVSPIVFEPQLNATSTHRLDPDTRGAPVALNFTAHVSTNNQHHTAAILQGHVKVQLWTNLPCLDDSTLDSVGGSGTQGAVIPRPSDGKDAAPNGGSVEWRAYDLQRAAATDSDWCVYHATLTVTPSSATTQTYGYTYRLAFADGRMEWLSYPHQDGNINLVARAACSSVKEAVAFAAGVETVDVPSTKDGISASAAYVDLRHQGGEEVPLASLNAPYRASSGIVMERTKSTWCTSRTFSHPSHVSPDFAASYILFDLEGDDTVLAIMPAISNPDRVWDLVRSRHPMSDGSYLLACRTNNRDIGLAKVAMATGPRSRTNEVFEVCRQTARTLSQESSSRSLHRLSQSLEQKDVSVLLNDFDGYTAILRSASADSLDTESESMAASEPGLPTLAASSSVGSDLTIESFESLPPTYESAMGLKRPSVTHCPHSTHSETTASPPRAAQSTATKTRPLDPRSGLGFCTWEAMGTDDRRPFLSKVVAAIEDLERRHGLGCITSILIDDGWQDIEIAEHSQDNRGRLKSNRMAEAMLDLDDSHARHNDDARDASEGDAPGRSVLSRYVSYLRKRFSSVEHVGVWMTLAGTWDGLCPEGEIASSLEGGLAEVDVHDPFRESDRRWLVPTAGSAIELFWSRTFEELRDAGVDFVKVDAQAEWDWIVADESHDGQRKVSSSSAFEAMQSAALRYLGPGSVIHSMSGSSATTNSARTLLLLNDAHKASCDAPTSLRITDDFFPNIPEAHRHHLVHNAYNALLLADTEGAGELRADADMFASRCRAYSGEDWASYHASFRAYSNAKLWISDPPTGADGSRQGKESGVSSLLARDRAGRLLTVQANEASRPLPGRLFEDLVGDGPGPALKLTSRNGAAGAVSVGFWNARGGNADSVDLVTPALLADAHQGGDIPMDNLALYRASTGQTVIAESSLLASRAQDPLMLLSLPHAGHDSLVVSPMQNADGVSLACLGLVDKFNGVQAMAGPGLLRADEAAPSPAEISFDAPVAAPSSGTAASAVGTGRPLAQVLALGETRWDAVRIMLLLSINTMFQSILFGLGARARETEAGSDSSDTALQRRRHDGTVTRALRRLRSGVGKVVLPASRKEMDAVRGAYLPLISLGLGVGRSTLRRPISTLKAAVNPFGWPDVFLRIPIAGVDLCDPTEPAETNQTPTLDDAQHHEQLLRYSIELLFAGMVGFVVRASAERLRTFRVKVDGGDVDRDGFVTMRMLEEGRCCDEGEGGNQSETALVTLDLEALAEQRRGDQQDATVVAAGWGVELAFV